MLLFPRQGTCALSIELGTYGLVVGRLEQDRTGNISISSLVKPYIALLRRYVYRQFINVGLYMPLLNNIFGGERVRLLKIEI